MRSYPRIGVALVAALILGGCGNDVPSPSEPGPTISPAAPAREIAELLAAPDSLVAAGGVYRATASVWRDFQPKIGTADLTLRAGIRLFATPRDTVPDWPKYVWVIHNGETWGAELQFARYVEYWDYVNAVSYGGPEWPVWDSVRVVIGVPDSTGFIRLLRCPDGVIEATS